MIFVIGIYTDYIPTYLPAYVYTYKHTSKTPDKHAAHATTSKNVEAFLPWPLPTLRLPWWCSSLYKDGRALKLRFGSQKARAVVGGWDFFCNRSIRKLTALKINGWNIIMEVWRIIFLSKWVICRFHVNLPGCTAQKTNIAVAGKWGPRMESMHFLLKMLIFQPAMLVYRSVNIFPPLYL